METPLMIRYSTKFPAIVVGMALLVLSLQIGTAQTIAEQIDSLMWKYQEYGQFNGSVLVADHGKVIFKKGYGLANMEWGIPNEPDTKFRLGSITKQFTSMLIIHLVQQGTLKLDGKITDYLPDYPKETGDSITIHQLLTHTSGIPGYTEMRGFFRDMSRDRSTPTEFVKFFADSALLFEPGAQWSYSNSGYFLLGVIIEKVTGKPYEQVLQENIFDPLGMKNTGFDHHETILAKRASGYERGGAGVINAPYLDMSLPYSAGSLYSTVEDLFVWDQALYTDKLLSKEFKALLFKPHFPTRGMAYGYGWMVGKLAVGRSSDSVDVITHGGGINGFNTLICRFPEDRSLVVLLNNTGGTRLGDMNRAIIGILHHRPYDGPKKSLAESLAEALVKNGIAAGLQFYRDAKTNHSEMYRLQEREMNNAGYQLMQAGKMKEAIVVFKLNVEEYPESSNVYDSLGEAYMTNGDTELAIKNYEQSVKMDPKNDNGVEMLKKLKKQ